MLVVVQSTPSRRQARLRTVASIEKSDIGRGYEIMENPEGVAPRQHFLAVLARMKEAEGPIVLRLEDDVAVNRHLRHNLAKWSAPRDRRFGVGWLFKPSNPRKFPEHARAEMMALKGPMMFSTDTWLRQPAYNASLGVVFRVADVPEIADRCGHWFKKHPGRLAQDLAMTWAIWSMGRHIVIHRPSLVQHLGIPSTLGHESGWTALDYSETWRRH